MKKLLFCLSMGLFLGNLQAMEHPENPFKLTPEEIEKSYPKPPTPYSDLGLQRTATHEEINKVYYGLKAEYDPSLFIDDNITIQNGVKKLGKKLDDAYSVLSNPGIRELYDQHGSNGIQTHNLYHKHNEYLQRRLNRRKKELENFQEKALKNFNANLAHIEILKRIVVRALQFYSEKKQYVDQSLQVQIKINTFALCYALGECFCKISRYDDAIECIDRALTFHTPGDKLFDKVDKIKKYYIQQKNNYQGTHKKRDFVKPTSVYRPRKRAKVAISSVEKEMQDIENAIKEKEQALKEHACALFSEIANESVPYPQFKQTLILVIPLLDCVQTKEHNPLTRTVLYRDYELTELLLKHGAVPSFHTKTQGNAFGTLTLCQPPEDACKVGHPLADDNTMDALLHSYNLNK